MTSQYDGKIIKWNGNGSFSFLLVKVTQPLLDGGSNGH